MATSKELTEENRKLKKQLRELKIEDAKVGEGADPNNIKSFCLVECGDNDYKMLDLRVNLTNKIAKIVRVKRYNEGRSRALHAMKRRIADFFILKLED